MKTKILSLIDEMEKDNFIPPGNPHNIKSAILEELRQEIDKMEDDTLKTIDEMIEELIKNDGFERDGCFIGYFQELKSRLSSKL